jgi:DNA-binding winged helix-turn-helix (wHTH) protein
MLKLADLANRPDFDAGPLRVSPARRLVEGPAGSTAVEPIVMKVFLLLFEARGSVVTRDELFAHAWGGVFVGDDSLNRAIGQVRKIAAETAPALFEIETIHRTGYRMTGEILASEPPKAGENENRRFGMSRRMMLGSAAAVGLAAAGGLGLSLVRRSREDHRFNELMDLGRQAQLYDDASTKAAGYFRQAVVIRPDNSKAQGLSAVTQAMMAEYGEQAGASAAVQRADRAARAALAIDANEPNARLALLTLERSTLDLATNEDRLREILATAPDNIEAMGSLWSLLQSAGRSRDALALIDRANILEPFAPAYQYPKAQLLWILGRTAEADRVIDRAMQYWPEHDGVRFARFTIYAYTGRPRAALAMLDAGMMKRVYTRDAVAFWRVSLAALDQRSPGSIATARRANLEAAEQSPGLTNQAVLVLSALGEVDAAFDVANQLLLYRRPIETRPKLRSAKSSVKSTSWRFAPWLFTPPTERMQSDPRFDLLCDGIGLTDYWRKRGITPDFRLHR